LALHREEFTWPPLLPAAPVSSYLTVSPFAFLGPVYSLLHLSSAVFAAARMLSGSLPYGVRTFLSSFEKRSPGSPNCLAEKL